MKSKVTKISTSSIVDLDLVVDMARYPGKWVNYEEGDLVRISPFWENNVSEFPFDMRSLLIYENAYSFLLFLLDVYHEGNENGHKLDEHTYHAYLLTLAKEQVGLYDSTLLHLLDASSEEMKCNLADALVIIKYYDLHHD